MGPSTDVPVDVVDALLRSWPLPGNAPDDDKDGRGSVLIVAGSSEIVGAAKLAATGALRAGVGKLVIATARSVAPGLALAMPEARVIGLDETDSGGLRASGAARLAALAGRVDAMLIGPGLVDEEAGTRFVAELLPALQRVPVLLDALAMSVVGSLPRFEQPVVMTPHAGEMAHLTGDTKDSICDDPHAAACEAAQRWNAVVALKGAITWIAAPGGAVWRHEGGGIGLATSGSGDVLAGIIVGLLARGAPPVQAAAWGVALHARAGERLASRVGKLGFLAREIPAEVPALLEALG